MPTEVTTDFIAVQARLAETITRRDIFNADDVSADGRFAVDHTHRANSRQNVIGTVFSWASGQGYIVPVAAAPPQSRNPHRKRSVNRLWRRTDLGLAWAVAFLEQTSDELLELAVVAEQLSLFEGVE